MKKTVLALSFISFTLCAMQTKQEPCYLARLPKDVQDMIAEYLSFRTIETDADFIWRTEIKSHNVSDYHRDAQQYRRPDGCFSAYSPDNLKKVFLDSSDPKKSKVLAWDTVPKEETALVSLEQVATLIDADKYYHQTVDVAISSDGQWFGRLGQRVAGYKKSDIWCSGNPANTAQISVVHIPTNIKREFNIPTLLKSVVFLDFNKQGTKIITHGVDFEKEERTWFMYNVVTEQEHKERSKKTLAEYVRLRGICKSLKNSL